MRNEKIGSRNLNKSCNGYKSEWSNHKTILLERESNRHMPGFEELYGPKYSENNQRIKSYILELKERTRVIKYNNRFIGKYSLMSN